MAGSRHIMDRYTIRRHISTLLIVVGLILLGYVALQYGRMWWAQRQLAEEWRKQSQLAELPGEADSGTEMPSVTPPEENKPGIARLQIPSIGLDAMVVEGTSNRALALGPGRITTTAIPGEKGNAAISGHRDSFFRRIHELKKGDEILVQRSGRKFHFQVTDRKIVQPTDVWVLNPTSDSQLTLITCYPTYYVGPAPERLVVFSKLVVEGSGMQTVVDSRSKAAVRGTAASASR